MIALAISAFIGIQLAYWVTTLSWVHDLPLFSSILEIYHLCFALFALPVLGTFGLQRWFARRRTLRELACVVPLIAVASLTIAYLYRFNAALIASTGSFEGVDITGYVQTQIMIAAVSALVVVCVLAASCFWYRPGVFWVVITLLFAIDQWIACRHLNPTMPRDEMYPQMALTDFMREQGKPVRFGVSEAAILSGGVANYDIEEWLGYDGLMPERAIRYQVKLGRDVWDHAEPASSIAYYLHDPNPDYDPLFPIEEMLERKDIVLDREVDGLQVYKNLRAFPRASLIGGLRSIPDRDALFEAMIDPEFRPERGVITEANPEHSLPALSETRPGTAEIVEYGRRRVVVEVDAEDDGVLLLTDAYYPGWTATVDGEGAEIFPAYYLFRGVLISAGRHEVVFEYTPNTLRIGLALSLGAMAFVNVLGIWAIRRRRVRRSV